jgi:glycosyltransferase involved in cell wall biosynthesis
MGRFPKIMLIFLAVDWPLFMRRRMVYALASAAKEYDTTVVAVNRPLCPFSTVLKKPQRIGEIFGRSRLEKLADNLYLFSPKYFIHDFVANRFGLFEKFNLAALRKAYRNLRGKLGINEKNPIVWYYYPQQGYVSNLFENSFCIYEIYDNLVDNEGRPLPFADKLQAKHRNSVNLLLTASQKQYEKYSPLYEQSKFFGNGLARQTYGALVKENVSGLPEILKVKEPRIGYVGMISERLNWRLIKNLADNKPEWNFVFVGPVADSTIEQKMTQYSNVHFLGAREISQIPAVLKSLDVGLLPYLENDFFLFLNPLKFYEYAAAGLPSVSSNIEELNSFPAELVKIVSNDNADEWIEAIDNFIEGDRTAIVKIGREIASKYIWEDMTAALLREIKTEYFSGK